VVSEAGSSSAIRHISGLHLYDSFWNDLLHRPRTLDLLEGCLGSRAEPVHSEVFYKPARVGTPAPIHQDNAYLQYDPPEGVAVWIALDKASVENGCIWYAKGSHKLGNLPHVKGDKPPFSKMLVQPPDPALYPEAPALLQPGEAVLHHVLTVHRSAPNLTDRNRRGLVLDYKGVNAQVDEPAHARHMAFVAQLHEQTAKA
jgi:ectoine hydroxylase-related dioxygenase (phytanoyl-CoA dioxygenase family)